ncbi:hypothetical protein Scep_028258 [Stephania cephalantha]|uniref:Uncharacterized protein n=1 Tax=Stephania cephalantha TaxID=152367 RepID=A0AAP0HLW9_9MAGN
MKATRDSAQATRGVKKPQRFRLGDDGEASGDSKGLLGWTISGHQSAEKLKAPKSVLDVVPVMLCGNFVVNYWVLRGTTINCGSVLWLSIAILLADEIEVHTKDWVPEVEPKPPDSVVLCVLPYQDVDNWRLGKTTNYKNIMTIN